MSDFWKKHDPDTGELNCVKFLRLCIEHCKLVALRRQMLVEAES
jgi:hypothetical protein